MADNVNYLKKGNPVYPRYSLFELTTNKDLVYHWSLFVQAYALMQEQTFPDSSTDQTSKSSYYGQIAGIHGLPQIPYPGEKTEKPSWGYCSHGIPTFPTWHRAYVKTIENSLIYYATYVFNGYTAIDKTSDVYLGLAKAIEELRFPYLDWDNVDYSHMINDIMSEDLVTVFAVPDGSSTKVRNPLKAFVPSTDIGNVWQGPYSNCFSKPNYQPPPSNPFLPKGWPTARHPTREYLDDSYRQRLVSLEYHQNTISPGMFQLFHNNDYFLFSNHSSRRVKDMAGPKLYGFYSSIEVYHDTIHDAYGGDGGHMSYPSFAAFDPIFFLHHCNVDRLFALWQLCYPNKWFDNQSDYYVPQPETNLDPKDIKNSDKLYVDQDLVPFYDADTKKYLTSNDVRNWETYGYTYSGNFFEQASRYEGPNTMLTEVLKYYGNSLTYRYIYFVDIENIEKNRYDRPYKVRVFFDDPLADQNTPTTGNPRFVGQIYVFARGNKIPCVNCENKLDNNIKAQLPLNKTLYNLNIDISVEDGQDLSDQSALEPQMNDFLKNIVLVAVDNNNTFLYRWTKAGTYPANLTNPPVVSINYMVNSLNKQFGWQNYLNNMTNIKSKVVVNKEEALKEFFEGVINNVHNVKFNRFVKKPEE